MDHYQTLGVNKNSTPAEIKKAYRKLAMKHHPDKGGDEAQFKNIQSAYACLSDPEKKRNYDQFGQEDPQWRRYDGTNFNDNFADIFGDIFGNFRQRRPQNPDGRMRISISLQDAYFGKSIAIGLENNTLNFDIPPGVRDGQQFVIPGRGPSRIPGAPPGDIILIIDIVMPMDYGREGNTLFVRAQVDAIDAIVGTEVDVQHINGKTYRLKVPAGCKEGQRIKMRGLGMPDPQNSVAGDLVVIMHVDVPTIRDEEILKVLNTIREKRGNNG